MYNKVYIDKNGMVGAGVGFERIRRITGYLVGDKSRWNHAKACELEDRIPHTMTGKHAHS